VALLDAHAGREGSILNETHQIYERFKAEQEAAGANVVLLEEESKYITDDDEEERSKSPLELSRLKDGESVEAKVKCNHGGGDSYRT